MKMSNNKHLYHPIIQSIFDSIPIRIIRYILALLMIVCAVPVFVITVACSAVYEQFRFKEIKDILHDSWCWND